MKHPLLRHAGISALLMLGLPWLAVTFAPGDAGMAICFLLFYGADPVYSVCSGYAAGKKLRQLWSSPVITAALFLVGAWALFDPGESLFVVYALVYLALGAAAMLISAWIHK